MTLTYYFYFILFKTVISGRDVTIVIIFVEFYMSACFE